VCNFFWSHVSTSEFASTNCLNSGISWVKNNGPKRGRAGDSKFCMEMAKCWSYNIEYVTYWKKLLHKSAQWWQFLGVCTFFLFFFICFNFLPFFFFHFSRVISFYFLCLFSFSIFVFSEIFDWMWTDFCYNGRHLIFIM